MSSHVAFSVGPKFSGGSVDGDCFPCIAQQHTLEKNVTIARTINQSIKRTSNSNIRNSEWLAIDQSIKRTHAGWKNHNNETHQSVKEIPTNSQGENQRTLWNSRVKVEAGLIWLECSTSRKSNVAMLQSMVRNRNFNPHESVNPWNEKSKMISLFDQARILRHLLHEAVEALSAVLNKHRVEVIEESLGWEL